MLRLVGRAVLGCLFVSGACCASIAQARSDEETVQAANVVLAEFLDLRFKQIPETLLGEAEGIAIIPDVIKVGFVVGGQHGRGVVVVKDKQGAWCAPVFMSLTGGSIGWQIGAQSTDIVLVFKTRKSVEGLLEGKFKLGADAAVAAGPVGRQASAATDGQLRAEIYSYSRSRGLFAGLSIDGSVLQIDREANAVYYGANPADGSTTLMPESAMRFVENIAKVTAGAEAAAAIPQPQPQLPFSPTLDPATVAPMPGPSFAAPLPAEPQIVNPPLRGLSPTTPVPVIPGPVTPFPNVPTPAAPRAALQADAVRSELAEVSSSLAPLLDDNWRRFLAMPAEVYGRGQHASPEAVQTTLGRYRAILDDPQYRTLNSRPEFLATHDLLKAYSDSLGSQRGQLLLPPLPNVLPR